MSVEVLCITRRLVSKTAILFKQSESRMGLHILTHLFDLLLLKIEKAETYPLCCQTPVKVIFNFCFIYSAMCDR